MSIKTLRKRVALVAAIALGTTVLALPSANAAAPDDIAQGDLNMTTTTASPGICAVDTTAGAESAVIVNGRTFRLTVDAGGTEKTFT